MHHARRMEEEGKEGPKIYYTYTVYNDRFRALSSYLLDSQENQPLQ
jgi:hypothetical protein